jgi:hypothetical protein
MINYKQLIKLGLPCMVPFYSMAQTKSRYNPLQVFDPSFFTHNGNELRSANGAPGIKYRQNSASYVIIDPDRRSPGTGRSSYVYKMP